MPAVEDVGSSSVTKKGFEKDQDTPQPSPYSPACAPQHGSWLRQALACVLCHSAGPAVHSYGEPSVHLGVRKGSAWELESIVEHEREEEGCGSQAGFHSLPQHIVESVLLSLQSAGRQTHFNVCGVCRTWRQMGRALYFASPWSGVNLISHPSQLFCLSPRPVDPSQDGLLKCFLLRTEAPNGTRLYRLYQGRDHRQLSRACFLMAAVQVSRQEHLFFLNREGRAHPAGRLAANPFCTSYRLQLAPSVRLVGDDYDDCGYRQVKSAPQVLGALSFEARISGFMMPRRMEVRLPPPAQLSFGPWLLPQLCREGGDLEASYHGGQGNFNTATACGERLGGILACDKAFDASYHGSQALPGPLLAAPASGRAHQSVESRVLQLQAASEAGKTPTRPQSQQQGQREEQDDDEGGSPAGWRREQVVLRNKAPQWNEELRCWCLNFRGRVKMASVKNLQLSRVGDDAAAVVVQFGKLERDAYILDFDPTVITAFQAMCIGLSTFNTKVML